MIKNKKEEKILEKQNKIILILIVFIILSLSTTVFSQQRTITLRTINRYEAPDYIEQRISDVEDEYDIKFEIKNIPFEKPGEDLETFFNALREQKPDWNLISSNNALLNIYITNQTVLPLNDYIDHDYFKKLPEPLQPVEEMVTYAGNIYGIPSPTGNVSYPFSRGMVILWNREFFERNNLPDLDELQDKGQWTWEKMTDIVKQATRDTNDDGYIDQWAIAGLENKFQYEVRRFFESYGANIYEEDVDGSIKDINLINDKVISVFEYLKEWYQLYPPYTNIDTNYNRFKNGNIGMYFTDLHLIFDIKENIDSDIGIAYLPKAPDMENNILPVRSFSVASVPILERDPETVINIHDQIFKPDDVYLEIDRELNKIENEKDRERYIEIISNWRASEFDLLLSRILFETGADIEEYSLISLNIYDHIKEIIKGDKEIEDGLMEIEMKIEDILF